MNELCHYRESILYRLSMQYKVEHQSLTYLSVFVQNADDPALRRCIREIRTQAHGRLKILATLLTSMNIRAESGYTGAVNGLVREGFQQLERTTAPLARDAIILQTLILMYQYKLGNYHIILRYLHALEWEYEDHVVRTLLADEEAVLRQLDRLLMLEADPVLKEPPPDALVLSPSM